MTAKQKKVAELLALGDPDKEFATLTKVEICERCELARSTLYSWLATPDFVDYINYIADKSAEARIGDYYRQIDKLIFENPRGPSIKALELIMRSLGKLKSDAKVELNVNDNKDVGSKTNDELMDEIAKMKEELGLGDT